MSSSSQTANYGLNQWEADDQVLREDFNRDNAILEDRLSRLDFVLGGYAGTGTANNSAGSQTIQLGFVPSLLIVFQKGANSVNNRAALAVTPDINGSSGLVLTGTSFRVEGYYNQPGTHVYLAWRQI